MLVLSRQQDETIMIGDDIEITVVDIRGDKVRLGISAPSRIAVHRKEVYLSIIRENEQAAKIGDDSKCPLNVPLPLTASVPAISPGPGRLRVATTIPAIKPAFTPPTGAPHSVTGQSVLSASKVPRAGPGCSDQAAAPPTPQIRKAV